MKSLIEGCRRFIADHRAQTDALSGIGLGLFILVVIGAVSIYVCDQIYDIADVDASSQFYTASTKVVDVMNTGWAMMLIVVIAIMAGVIIWAIRGVGGAGGGEAGV
ncbi:MAG: hypothetical protein DRI26_08705 [Chloroflexi bacterium]|mgnify:CR=1 FL=1|nr:MAG: hypothetical protein DRI26_08705 [Chloroflexota bacterium]